MENYVQNNYKHDKKAFLQSIKKSRRLLILYNNFDLSSFVN
jgi:hypothetical protein